MKTFMDRLISCPLELLKLKIKQQEAELAILQRDLETMKRVLVERTAKEE